MIAEFPSAPGYYCGRDGSVWCTRPRNGKGSKLTDLRPIKPLLSSQGRYQQFSADGKKFLINRAVWESFNGPVRSGKEVAHLDGNPRNNRLSNLSEKTHKENEADKVAHGTSAHGERNPNVVISSTDVEEIYVALRCGARGTARRLAARYGVSAATISMIRLGKRWACLGLAEKHARDPGAM